MFREGISDEGKSVSDGGQNVRQDGASNWKASDGGEYVRHDGAGEGDAPNSAANHTTKVVQIAGDCDVGCSDWYVGYSDWHVGYSDREGWDGERWEGWKGDGEGREGWERWEGRDRDGDGSGDIVGPPDYIIDDVGYNGGRDTTDQLAGVHSANGYRWDGGFDGRKRIGTTDYAVQDRYTGHNWGNVGKGTTGNTSGNFDHLINGATYDRQRRGDRGQGR